MFSKSRELLLSFYHDVASDKRYWLPVSFFAVLSYGFSVFSRTVSIDDLARSIYVGEGTAMIRGMRWGLSFWARLFSTLYYSPFIDKFVSVIFLFVGLVLINAVLYEANGKKNNIWQYVIFSSLFITYPLINEIWEYNGANTATSGNLILVGAALLYQLTVQATTTSILVSGIILSPVMSGYESGVFTYISLVVMILYVKYGVNASNNDGRGGGTTLKKDSLLLCRYS